MLNGALDVFQYFPILGNPVVLGQSGQGVDLLIEGNGVAVVRILRSHHDFGPKVMFALAEAPEAAFAVMTQGPESPALIIDPRLGGQQKALLPGKQISRRKPVNQAGQGGALLNIVIAHRQAEDIQVGAVQRGKIIHHISPPVAEQVVQPLFAQAGYLVEPPVGLLE